MDTIFLLSVAIGEHEIYDEIPLMAFQKEVDANERLRRFSKAFDDMEVQFKSWIEKNNKLHHNDRWTYNSKKDEAIQNIIDNNADIDGMSKKEVFNIIHNSLGKTFFVIGLNYIKG